MMSRGKGSRKKEKLNGHTKSDPKSQPCSRNWDENLKFLRKSMEIVDSFVRKAKMLIISQITAQHFVHSMIGDESSIFEHGVHVAFRNPSRLTVASKMMVPAGKGWPYELLLFSCSRKKNGNNCNHMNLVVKCGGDVVGF
eukprot:jgi/Bigna1/135639/aug1.30_g10347